MERGKRTRTRIGIRGKEGCRPLRANRGIEGKDETGRSWYEFEGEGILEGTGIKEWDPEGRRDGRKLKK